MPTQALKLTGSWRAKEREATEPKPTGKPHPPSDLTDAERAVWDQLATNLESMPGVATVADALPLTALSLFYSLFISEWREAQKDGPMVTLNGQIVPNPHLSLALRLWQECRRIAPEFGIGAASRSRVSIDAPEVPDELDTFLSERGQSQKETG